MKRETRVALLVGMTFIAMFGLVLGRRSLKIASASRSDPLGPGPEVSQASRLRARTVRAADPLPPAGEQPPQQPPAEVASPPSRPSEPQTPPARPQVPAPRRRIYTVGPGDNLTRIARKVYGAGHGREHRRIFLANRENLPDPNKLTPGQKLTIPPLPADSGGPTRLAAAPPRPAGYREMTLEALSSRFRRGGTYVVSAGDTLSEIAQSEMGSGSRATVRRLYEANRSRISDPNRLAVGLRLQIPVARAQ